MQWIENRTLESFRNNFKQVLLKRKATYLVKSSIKHSGKKTPQWISQSEIPSGMFQISSHIES